ncbi:unnamed protein product [Larinioides sclopetarius]|uniref:Uncharacterized protein n=1 Tax=Larinioides sclopetarius TaxID=280406 RepID=A0AAV1ZIG7_9ARAC
MKLFSYIIAAATAVLLLMASPAVKADDTSTDASTAGTTSA